MPSDARPLPSHIAVAGNGQVGLAAAIALRRALPRTQVTLVPCQADPSAIADRAITSLPRTNAFHDRFGLDEKGFVVRAGASHRLGVRFRNWNRETQLYLHAYGTSTMAPKSLSVGQTLIEGNMFGAPSDDNASPLSDIDYALRYNPAGYIRRLTALASHLGVRKLDVPMRGAFSDGKGGLSHIRLSDDSEVAADLFVDATGSLALLADATRQAHFESWSAMLPCNRLLFTQGSTDRSLRSTLVSDEIETTPFGWQASIFGRDGVHYSFAFCSDISIDPDIAERWSAQTSEIFAFEPGRLSNSWIGNVVAFGDAAAIFEPLHWANLALAHEQILLFLELLPGRDIVELERTEYNRRASAMADRVRDFIGLHYCAPSPPDGAFWRHATNLQRSADLSLTLSEFIRRGRLPFFEEEIFPRDGWLSAMACIGVVPGANAQTVAMCDSAVSDRLTQQRLRSAQATAIATPYPDWLKYYTESKA